MTEKPPKTRNERQEDKGHKPGGHRSFSFHYLSDNRRSCGSRRGTGPNHVTHTRRQGVPDGGTLTLQETGKTAHGHSFVVYPFVKEAHYHGCHHGHQCRQHTRAQARCCAESIG